LNLVFPVASKLLKDKGRVVALIKPQFEAGKEQVGKKGIVRDKSIHKEVIEKVIDYGVKVGLYPTNLTYSPLTGAKGNIEYLMLLEKNDEVNVDLDVDRITDLAHNDLLKD
jgi:23S rRNA (cytidine1920-2'-O)/16S rRNA (cytidine1409-2'-O)-methyltransferase